MVISAMHIRTVHGNMKKSSKMQPFTYLEIIMMKFRKHHSYEFLKLSWLYDAEIQRVISEKFRKNSHLNYQ